MYLWTLFLAFSNVITLDLRLPVRVKRTLTPSNDTVDAVNFLRKYGYLPADKGRASVPDMKEAVKLMQVYYHLPLTGELDNKTIEMMGMPRCGCPDKEIRTKYPKLPNSSLAFTLGPAWKKTELTWTITDYYSNINKISKTAQRKVMKEAFAVWQQYIPLRFHYTEGTADLNIKFAWGNHGDGIHNAFDGSGNVLAHAYYPPDGNIHFDSEEDWIISSDDGIEMFTVAAHEFGHALGLAHSTVEYSLMAPLYAGYDSDFKLHIDDITGIQRLYGGAPVDRTTTKPKTTTPKPTGKEGCDVAFLAAVLGTDNYLYAFNKHLVYKIGDEGLMNDFPKHISKVFPWAPNHVDAAFQYHPTKQVVLIKGARIWMYTDFRLDPSYPKYINVEDFPERPTGSICVEGQSARNIIFGKKRWWEWSWDRQVLIGSDYPMYYRYQGAPVDFDSIVSWKDGYTYIFKGKSYYKIDETRRSVLSGYPKDIGPAWIQRQCGHAPW